MAIDPRRGRSGARAAGRARSALALAVGLAGCGEAPALEVRWRFYERELDEAGERRPGPPLRTPSDCARFGVHRIRIEARPASGPASDRVVASRTVRCAPRSFADPQARVAGPPLEPGRYRISVVGLRRDGQPWPCGLDPLGAPSCETALSSADLEIVEGQTARPDEFVLVPPPECADGLDNDGDGLVDGFDPACRRDPLAPESADTNATLITVRASFLGDNPEVRCNGLGIAGLRAQVRDAQGELVATRTRACEPDRASLVITPFALVLSDGDYTVETFAFAPGEGFEPRTIVQVTPFTVTDGQGAYVQQVLDFPGDSFLAPVVGPPRFFPRFRASAAELRGCAPTPTIGGDLVLDRLRWVIRDERGVAIDPGEYPFELLGVEGELALLACPEQAVGGPPVVWGDWTLQAEGLAGDQVCFATAQPVRLAPRAGLDAVAVTLARIVDDQGRPPPGCRDCGVDADCDATAQCVQFICQAKP